MNPLVYWRLQQYCEKHGLDEAEIDNTLTHEENMVYLRELAGEPEFTLEEQAEEMMAQHHARIRERTLTYYIQAQGLGENVSEDVGDPSPPQRTPLADFIKSR